MLSKSSKKAAKPAKPAKSGKTAKHAPAKATAHKAPAKAAVPPPAAAPVVAPGAKARASAAAARARGIADEAATLAAHQAAAAKHLTGKELKQYKDLLLRLRDRISDEISFLANDNLNRSQRESAGDLSSYSFHMADQGTDNFDREFAANLLSGEQDVLYEIDDALRRVDQKTYGICELSGKPIEKERLKVLPYARFCVAVQSEMERGKPKFRPFKRFSFQQASEVESR
jgi:DnaK suppressor protein